MVRRAGDLIRAWALCVPPPSQALKVTGLRGIIQKGWGGLGANVTAKFDDVLFIGQVRTCPGQLGV